MFYSFKCEQHGMFEVYQKMNDEHIAYCPTCRKKAVRIYLPLGLGGDLPTKKFSLGKTREELFCNLGKEGLEERDMWKHEKHEREEAIIKKQKGK